MKRGCHATACVGVTRLRAKTSLILWEKNARNFCTLCKIHHRKSVRIVQLHEHSRGRAIGIGFKVHRTNAAIKLEFPRYFSVAQINHRGDFCFDGSGNSVAVVRSDEDVVHASVDGDGF